jgi:hypothetical protein
MRLSGKTEFCLIGTALIDTINDGLVKEALQQITVPHKQIT